jgi:hypothetical protein
MSIAVVVPWLEMLILGCTLSMANEIALPYDHQAVALRENGPSGGRTASFQIINAPHGFVVDGSSINSLNGIYGPRQDYTSVVVPSYLKSYVNVGLYRHVEEDNGWILANLYTTEDLANEENEWVFIDPSTTDRLVHAGDVLVPGFGNSWKHVHRSPRAGYGGSADEKRGQRHHQAKGEPTQSRQLQRTSSGVVFPDSNDASDAEELPKIVAPITADPGSSNTSYVFEQLLVQYLRQKRAEAESQRARACSDNVNDPNHCETRARLLLKGPEDGPIQECFRNLERARGFRRAREFDAAIHAIHAILAVEPQFPGAYKELGMLHLDAGRPKDALTAFETLYALNSEDGPDTMVHLLVLATTAVKRAALFDAERERNHGTPPPSGCEILQVGPHYAVYPHNKKTVCCITSDEVVCPSVVNSSNWATEEVSVQGMHMTFTVERNADSVTVSRGVEEGVTITHGWDIDLKIQCCIPPLPRGVELPSPANVESLMNTAEAAPAVFADHFAVLGVSRDFEFVLHPCLCFLSLFLVPCSLPLSFDEPLWFSSSRGGGGGGAKKKQNTNNHNYNKN